MPKFDGRGPRGEGKMTGRGLGKCANKGEKNIKETKTKENPNQGLLNKVFNNKQKKKD